MGYATTDPGFFPITADSIMQSHPKSQPVNLMNHENAFQLDAYCPRQ